MATSDGTNIAVTLVVRAIGALIICLAFGLTGWQGIALFFGVACLTARA